MERETFLNYSRRGKWECLKKNIRREILLVLERVATRRIPRLTKRCRSEIFSNFLNSRHTEKRTKIFKAEYQFLRRELIIKIPSNKIVFRSSITKILIILLFLNIMLITDFHDFFIARFLFACFLPPPKLPRHICRASASHRCAATHRLTIAGLGILLRRCH
jgi:hypothetical protein